MPRPNCEPKGLSHALTFSRGCLAITTSLFFLGFSTLLIHRICANLHGWACICPRSQCVTTRPSHSCAKPQWWRTWSILGLVGRGFVEEWETPGRSESWPWRPENPGDWRTVGSCVGNSGWQCVFRLHYSDMWSLLEYYQRNCISTYHVVKLKVKVEPMII